MITSMDKHLEHERRRAMRRLQVGDQFTVKKSLARVNTAPPDTPELEDESFAESILLDPNDRVTPRFTDRKYAVREDKMEVDIEIAIRQYLATLSPRHEHVINSDDILLNLTGRTYAQLTEAAGNSLAQRFIRRFHKILRYYLGKSFKTHIRGLPVAKAYRVRQGFHVLQKTPMALSLKVRFNNRTLREIDLAQRNK